MPTPKPKKNTRLLLNLGAELRERIDKFRFDQHFESRSAAIRWLLEFALKQNPKPKQQR